MNICNVQSQAIMEGVNVKRIARAGGGPFESAPHTKCLYKSNTMLLRCIIVNFT